MSSSEYTLKEALDKFVDYYKLRAKLDERKIEVLWKEVVGKSLAEHTGSIELKNKKLYVKVADSVVRQELIFMRSRIIQVINRKFNTTIIEEVIIM